MLSAILLVFLVVLWILYIWNRRQPGLPPFPSIPLPVVGNLLSLGKDPRKLFAKWRKKHGDMFSLYLGSKLVIVLNGYTTIRDALVKHADMFSDRPNVFIFTHVLRGRGIIATSGPAWKSQRTISLSILRKFGFGRHILEDKILEEVEKILNFIDKDKGVKTDYCQLYKFSTSNITCSVLFGKSFDYDDPRFIECLDSIEALASSVAVTGMANFLPWLQYFPGNLAGINSILDSVDCYEKKLVKSEIQRHIEEYDGSSDDFISAYIKEVKSRESAGEDTTDLRDNFTQTVSDLILGGTETTATTLKWLVLFLICFPEVQDKCFQEIKENVGVDRLPVLKDMPTLPYVEATLAETQRRGNIIPFGVFHSVPETTRFGDFVFPKGVVVMANVDSVMMDPDVWLEPNDFRPERFIGKDGMFFKPKEHIPFLMGRRACVGKAMAKMELFLIGTALIQRFHFQQPEDEPLPSLDPIIGATAAPALYKVKAIPRN